MAKLTSTERNNLKESDFALPGRRYPIENEAHARNALARAAQHGTAEEIATIRRKVHERYPGIKEEGEHEEKHGRGKSAKNKTPQEAYTPARGKAGEKRRVNDPKVEKKRKMTSGERFMKHFSG